MQWIETVFFQLCDPFMIIRNQAKQTAELFIRIISKISVMTILKYINKINNKSIGLIKYTLIKFRQRVRLIKLWNILTNQCILLPLHKNYLWKIYILLDYLYIGLQ